MKNIIKYHLLTEGRVEDTKKKYPYFPAYFIDYLSKHDPSGNNKYLDWMMHEVYVNITKNGRYNTQSEIEHHFINPHTSVTKKNLDFFVNDIIKTVESFHKNVDRLLPERVYEALMAIMGFIPRDFAIVGDKEGGKLAVWGSKNINSYTNYSLKEVLNYIINNYPSKSEINNIRKKETINIFEDDIIKIVAPQSYASSCMYGANTRWCTTSKTRGQEYFNNYTSKNQVLIYFIFKNKYKDSKLALHIHPHRKERHWFDDHDNNVKGLPILEEYINIFSDNPKQEFKTIKEKVNQYIKSKDERSYFSKIFKSGKI